MEKDIRLVYAEFNEEATKLFFALFNEFANAVDAIERDGYENVFQLLRAKYSSLLKQRLEKNAGILINKCEQAGTQGRLRISFTETINFFLKEFTRKSELV